MSIPIEDVLAGRVDFSDVIEPGADRLPPLHPGKVLREEFLEPLGMSAYSLAKAINVPLNRVTAILAGERAVTADTALRLARVFGTSAEMWIRIQAGYDLETTRIDHGAKIDAEVRPQSMVAPD